MRSGKIMKENQQTAAAAAAAVAGGCSRSENV